ncbi:MULTISPECIES: inositol monophosphatase family protein [unclassified Mesorhizobium]|uniref:inositol monophosphatase family protein n=1 Tax=unclassified Mesorhizobium TaxID=325217 RepID=UPI0019D477BE|nr:MULTISPECIES: inositol monophosphatase family protein [unclassified Mesorhizobium]
MIDVVEAIALEAGEIAIEHFHQDVSVTAESKGYLDLVTQADREVERVIVDRLRASFPDDGIVGEEGSAARSRSGRTWVIDPIDGTLNFVRGSDQWSISIGLFDGRRPVFGVLNLPAQAKLVFGGVDVPPRLNGHLIPPLAPIDPSRAAVALGFGPADTDSRRADLVTFVSREAGMVFRNSGCGSVSLLSVALGHVDGYISLGESSWDVMAGLAIIGQLGGESTVDWRDVGLHHKFPIAAGTHDFLVVASRFSALGRAG